MIALSGEAISPAQAVSTATAANLRGDYISLNAVAGAYDKAGNNGAAKAIRNLMPDIAECMKKMLEASEMIKTIKYGVNQIARPYYEVCEALGDPCNPVEFVNPFEMEQWRAEAGL